MVHILVLEVVAHRAVDNAIENSPNHLRPCWRYSSACVLMARPLFLVGTTPLYLLGLAAVWNRSHSIDVSLAVLGMVLVWLVQLVTHYNNEYQDLETDQATMLTTRISGGSRVLVRGLVPRSVPLFMAQLSFALAVILALVLAFNVGYFTLVLAGGSLLIGWSYSGPPLKLINRGLGEAGIVIASALLLPATAYYLQTSQLDPTLLLAAIPLGLVTFAVALATELADIEPDRATGKLTLAARLGLEKSTMLQATLAGVGCLSFIIVIVYLLPDYGWLAVLPALAVLVASLLHGGAANRRVYPAMERMALLNSLLLGYCALAFTAALLYPSLEPVLRHL